MGALVLAPVLAGAQSVSLAGSMGNGRALLLIDGQPQTLAVGASARGVTLRRLGDGEAEVEVGGQRQLLRLGASPAQVGIGASTPSVGNVIVLPASEGGHFVATGTINGRTVQFTVDTGATTVALSQSEANRIGLDWKSGQRGQSMTANGLVPVHSLTLSSVKIAGVEVMNVRATVLPAEMPVILLGNSFLDRFTMRRDGDTMRLEKKP
ncbi:retropepsin-like aspartic protease [Ideonella sp. DXS22W]|uniref:Retropepsin-like aspartic protease n=1 Tax=Pseudaquabacterium inlustre TaxID=2984192 RepID=A0ABU9CE97_9BURK